MSAGTRIVSLILHTHINTQCSTPSYLRSPSLIGIDLEAPNLSVFNQYLNTPCILKYAECKIQMEFMSTLLLEY